MTRKFALATLTTATLTTMALQAGGFDDFYKKFGELDVNQGYHVTNKEIKKKAKKLGYYASTKEVEGALKGEKVNGKPVVVIDSRTKAEQEGLHLEGATLSNLRGWNKAFVEDNMHSDKLGAVYSYCRTGTDQADNIVHLQWLFQGKAKIFGIKDMVDACYPTVSKSGHVLDAKLNAKHTYVQQGKDGKYYEVNCPQVENACTPIAVYSQKDIEVAQDVGEKLPQSIVMKNKKLGKEITAFKGADNYYYKKECWK